MLSGHYFIICCKCAGGGGGGGIMCVFRQRPLSYLIVHLFKENLSFFKGICAWTGYVQLLGLFNLGNFLDLESVFSASCPAWDMESCYGLEGCFFPSAHLCKIYYSISYPQDKGLFMRQCKTCIHYRWQKTKNFPFASSIGCNPQGEGTTRSAKMYSKWKQQKTTVVQNEKKVITDGVFLFVLFCFVFSWGGGGGAPSSKPLFKKEKRKKKEGEPTGKLRSQGRGARWKHRYFITVHHTPQNRHVLYLPPMKSVGLTLAFCLVDSLGDFFNIAWWCNLQTGFNVLAPCPEPV